jgi:hypothetical protein
MVGIVIELTPKGASRERTAWPYHVPALPSMMDTIRRATAADLNPVADIWYEAAVGDEPEPAWACCWRAGVQQRTW